MSMIVKTSLNDDNLGIINLSPILFEVIYFFIL